MKRKCLKPLLFIVLLSSLAGTLQAQITLYVKQGGTGDGSSWANASGDLQSMMNAAANGGTVLVAGGTYYPTTSLDQNISFLLPKAGGVKIFGGYNAATGIRSVADNLTILSGDIGTTGYIEDNSYHVLVIAGTDAGADSVIIDGLTVTKGWANGLGGSGYYNGTKIRDQHGGGICVVTGGKVAIRNTTITNNKAVFRGGGMFNEYSSPLIENCLVTGNESTTDYNFFRYEDAGGGGIYNRYAVPIISRTTIKQNISYRGGGMVNYGCSPLINNCLFEGNNADMRGGAVYDYSPAYYEESLPVFTYCVFTDNRAGLGGVGYAAEASPTYNNCIFYNNKAVGSSGNGYGSCFYGVGSRYLTIKNCVSAGNFSSVDNAIVWLSGSLRMSNSIIYGNTGSTDIYLAGISYNTEIGYNLFGSMNNSGATIAYQGGNLIGAYNPLFINPANPIGPDGVWGTSDDGLQLQSTSPVINTGNNSMIPIGVTADITGAQRIQGGTVDMGAYESPSTFNCGFPTLYVDGNRSGSGPGDSWATAFKTLSEAMERARYCSNVNTILVAKGTYYPTGVQGGSNRDSAFLIPQRGGIKIYGGYPNGGGVRNPKVNHTILSGDIGTSGDNSDNSYHILVMTETLAGADSVVIDGFTFTGANANGNQYYYNNALTNQNEGGGMLIRQNSNLGSKIAVRNCNIINNNAITFGAGIYLWESSALISNCVIANNTANEGGAGIFNIGSASSRLVNCVLNGNNSKNGAAVYNKTTLSIVSSTLSGNTASVQGSSIYNIGASNTTTTNTILWNNGTNNIYNSGTLNITYSNVEQGSGVYSGTGNINANPLFVNLSNPVGPDGIWRTSDDGLKLQAGSPAINAGTPDTTGLSLNPYDLQESERILAARIDMGSYESPYIRCAEITNVLHVDGSVSQSGNGSSWSNAFKTFTEALIAVQTCADINTVLVAKGTYYPSSLSNRDDAFLIPRRGDIKIYGGYPAGGGTRDLVANPTILSGDIGSPGNNGDNSYHVMVIANTNAGADSIIIDGFTFTNANGHGSGPNTLNETSVDRNTGGGLTLVNNNGNSKISIRNCRFINNTAHQGAGIFNTASSPRIINSYIQGNSSSDNGGGISNYNNSAPTFINVLIAGNRATYGGAVFNDNSSPVFINTTIADNYASYDVGGLYNRYNNTNVIFRNSIIYGNRIPDGSPSNIYNTSSGKANFSYSLIESATEAWDPGFGTNNGNNLFTDPLFAARVNPTGANTPNTSGNYQLQSASPVVDAGNNALLPADINTDIINAVRSQQFAADMGAFESPYFNCDMFIATTTQTDVKCYGTATGIASVVVSQGVAPYTYSWSNGAQTASINNIVAGNYTCTVTDANGCSLVKTFTISQPGSALSAATSQTNIACFNTNTGSAAVIVSGGTAPYYYSWSNGGTTATINNLAPGNYTCTITDANGCSIIKTFTINQPATRLSAIASQTNIACFNTNTGAITVLGNGGTTPYYYNWSNGGTTTTINNLAPGNYSCIVTDANGCSVVRTFTINQPAAALSAATSQTNIACFNTNTGSAAVAVSGGTAPYYYSWSNGGTTATINNLAPGNYSCTITDNYGCFLVKTFTITQPSAALSAATSQTNIACFNTNTGSAVVAVSGGTAPYYYSWSNGGTTATINNLAAGNYTCTITDANGCSLVKTFTISQPAAALSATTSQTNLLCFNGNTGSATVAVSGGTVPYFYNWSNGGTTATINNLASGNYTCVITDANGCMISKTLTITEPGELKTKIVLQNNVFCSSGNTGLAIIQANGGVTPYVYQWSNGSTTTTASGLAPGNYSCLITDANGCTINTPVNIIQQSISGNKIFVDSAIAVSGAGNSWAGAFKYLSDALNAAATCNGIDSILVAKGTYYPVGSQANFNKDSTFLIRQSGGLKIYGGYPTGGGARDLDANKTILSGDIGLPGNNMDNSHHVMVIAGITPGADSIVIDGFTIKQGSANRITGYYYNGIEIDGLSGSGLYLHNTNNGANKISIRNCSFTELVTITGVAIYNQQSSPEIAHCKFFGNYAVYRGGAIANDNSSSPIISHCEFSVNESGDGGAAIYNVQNSNAKIRKSSFLNNISTGTGGAILNESSSPVITDCYIAGNTAYYGSGGGICNDNASPTIINSYFIGNTALQNAYGGGLANFNSSSTTVTNCTFYGNAGSMNSGSIWNDGSHLNVTNSILYGTDYGIRTNNAATTSVSYSLIQGWSGGGTGNLNSSLDPMFVAPFSFSFGTPFTSGDYRLRACSPAINTGIVDTTGLSLPLLEMTGLPRIQLGRIDLGANEANSYTNQNAGTIPTTVTTATAYQLKDGTTWYAIDCNTLIAAVKGSGNNPVSGNTTATVDKDDNLLPGAVSRYYEITPDNDPSTSSGTITLYFTQAEFDAYNSANNGNQIPPFPDKDDADLNDKIANIRIRKVSGAITTIITPQTVSWNGIAERWEITFDVPGFSKFYVFTEKPISLPLRLIDFAAKEKNCMANISWTTAGETGVSHFEVEQSTDGTLWSVSSKTTASNTGGENRYNVNASITASVNYYRLKMVDMDGTTTYSKVVQLIFPLNCSRQIIKLYPNPATDIVYLEKAGAGDVYSIYDNNGRKVLQGNINKTVQDIAVKRLAAGMYSIVIINAKGETQSLKFIKQSH